MSTVCCYELYIKVLCFFLIDQDGSRTIIMNIMLCLIKKLKGMDPKGLLQRFH